jgi:nitrite reductase/ring-hydroxylating ferredoxin subunit
MAEGQSAGQVNLGAQRQWARDFQEDPDTLLLTDSPIAATLQPGVAVVLIENRPVCAVSSTCPHRQRDLTQYGRITTCDDGASFTIECSHHGYVWDGRTGELLSAGSSGDAGPMNLGILQPQDDGTYTTDASVAAVPLAAANLV